MSATNAWLQKRLDALDARIEAHETAGALAAAAGAQSYTLDTGQSRGVVMRYEVSSLEKTIAALTNQYIITCNRMGKTSSRLAIPSF